MLTQRGISISDESRLPPKVRAFIVDKDSGRPLSGIVTALVAEPDDKIYLPLGMLVSDAAGYVSFDLETLRELHVSRPKHLWLYATGDETSRIDVRLDQRGETATAGTEAARSDTPNPSAKFCFPFLLKVNAKLAAAQGSSSINLPSIQNPDPCDWELSPYSFAIKNDLTLGEAGCEVPVPSMEAEREYRFSQVVRTATPRPSRDVGYTAGRNLGESGPGASSLRIAPVDPTVMPIPATMPITQGEVLEFRQTWIPKGHSLGTILYSVALAPCESVNIAIIDWSREDEITRTDTVVSKESLKHKQKRDRTIDETVDAALNELQGGDSFMAGHGGAAAATVPIGGVPVHFGGTHAIGWTASKSWGHRDLFADSGQQLHDTIVQQTNVTRSLNSTVMIQATQEERNYLETRTIANHNHCHAMTIQYYEVLRRFKIITEYVRSRPVVLVPFKLLIFTAEIALRYRAILETVLLDAKLISCFDAIVRLHYCPALYDSTALTNGNGDQTGQAAPPSGTKPLYRLAANDHFYTTSKEERDNAIATYGYKDEGIACYVFETQVAGTKPLYRLAANDHFYTTSKEERDNAIATYGYKDEGIACYVFETQVAETKPLYRLAANDHFYTTSKEERDNAIATYGYKDEGIACYVFEAAGGRSSAQPQPEIAWYDITLKSGKGGYSTTSGDIWVEILHGGSWKEIFHKDAVRTGGKELDKGTFSKQVNTTGRPDIAVDPAAISRVRVRWREDGDLDYWDFKGITVKYGLRNVSGSYKLIDKEGHTVPTNSKSDDTGLKWFDDSGRGPNDWQEWADDALKPGTKTKDKEEEKERKEERPQPTVSRREDACCEQQLTTHLNANLGYYNRAIWLLQDPSERVIMLNAALAAYPELLDSIDTTPMAVSGNYVAFAYNSEQTKEEEEKEKNRLKKNPLRESIVSLPTRGVFAETHLSHCNACEVRDVTRFWKWEESPCEKPPPIEGITPGPRGQTPTIQPTTLPSPVVQIMQPPAAPDPVGLAAALNLLGQPNIFRDMSGLKELQDLLSGLASGAVDLAKGQQQLQALKEKLEAQQEMAKLGRQSGSGSGPTRPQSASELYDKFRVLEDAEQKGDLTPEQANKAREAYTQADVGRGGAGAAGPLPLRLFEEMILGATPTAEGSEPTISEAKKSGIVLTTMRLSRMSKDEFFGELTQDERAEWYRITLGPYSKQLRESATFQKIPAQVLATVIFAELIDIGLDDIAQDTPCTFKGSLGIAQIQVKTAIDEKLFTDITSAEETLARDACAQFGAIVGGGIIGGVGGLVLGAARRRQLAVARRLRIPQHSIDAAAKYIKLHLIRASGNRNKPWATLHGFTWTGSPLQQPADIYNHVAGADLKEREGELAAMVAGIHNSPTITGAQNVSGAAFPSAQFQADSARRIAEELYDLPLFH